MLRDLRFALHLIVKERWYSAVAVVTLALGIGMNATVFTLVNAVLFKGLPFKDSHNLYMISSLRQSGRGGGVSFADLQDWRAQTKTFEGLGGFAPDGMNLSDDRTAPQQVRSARVTANTFALLGQPPVLGRDFATGDDHKGAENIAILSYRLWNSRYGGDRGILGRSVRLDGRPTTIIGVMPDGMLFPSDTEVWTPAVPTAEEESRGSRSLDVFGRLRRDSTRAAAQTEFSGIAGRLAAAYPDTNKDFAIAEVQTFSERFNGGPIRVVFLAMMGAVAFVLLIACANVANLLLSRSVHRSREIAVRIALGATRWRVVRQLLVESLLLGFLGGVLGLALAVVGVRLFDRAVANTGKPYWIVFTFDPIVFGFLALVCVLTGVLFGLAPALQVTRTNVHDVLKEGGRGNAGGVRARWLIGNDGRARARADARAARGRRPHGQELPEAVHARPRDRTEHLMTMRHGAAEPEVSNPGDAQGLLRSAEAAARRPPGQRAVAFTTSVPPFGSWRRPMEVEGRPCARPTRKRPRWPSSRSARSSSTPSARNCVAGATSARATARPDSRAAIINERLASQFFAGEDPIGRRIKFTVTTGPGQTARPPEVWRTIVGICPIAAALESAGSAAAARRVCSLPPGGARRHDAPRQKPARCRRGDERRARARCRRSIRISRSSDQDHG